MWFKTLDRRPVAAGVSPVGLSPDYHFNSGAVRYADGWWSDSAVNGDSITNAEEELGLRPELTASIARTAVTRMAGVTYPQRLYNANVFRRTRKEPQSAAGVLSSRVWNAGYAGLAG